MREYNCSRCGTPTTTNIDASKCDGLCVECGWAAQSKPAASVPAAEPVAKMVDSVMTIVETFGACSFDLSRIAIDRSNCEQAVALLRSTYLYRDDISGWPQALSATAFALESAGHNADEVLVGLATSAPAAPADAKPVSRERAAEIDATVGLKGLPPIRLAEHECAALALMAQERGYAIVQPLVRDLLRAALAAPADIAARVRRAMKLAKGQAGVWIEWRDAQAIAAAPVESIPERARATAVQALRDAAKRTQHIEEIVQYNAAATLLEMTAPAVPAQRAELAKKARTKLLVALSRTYSAAIAVCSDEEAIKRDALAHQDLANAAETELVDIIDRLAASSEQAGTAGAQGEASCLCCGKVGEPAAWKLGEPMVYVCSTCKRRATAAAPDRFETEAEGDAYMHGWFEGQEALAATPSTAAAQRVDAPVATVHGVGWELNDAEVRVFGVPARRWQRSFACISPENEAQALADKINAAAMQRATQDDGKGEQR